METISLFSNRQLVNVSLLGPLTAHRSLEDGLHSAALGPAAVSNHAGVKCWTAGWHPRTLPAMAMAFEELDGATREFMLGAFEAEEGSGNPYRSQILSPEGLLAFPDLMREAIQGGDETTLAVALNLAAYWKPVDAGGKKVNVPHRSEQLGLTEFNTWYVAGFAQRLTSEGEAQCNVYRAAQPKREHALCSQHEGQVYSLIEIIAGHRIGYWPPPGVPGQLAIPAGPGCHHTIRRLPG